VISSEGLQDAKADGKTSLRGTDKMFTSSFGCTSFTGGAPMTSLEFMFEEVPERSGRRRRELIVPKLA